MYTVLNRFNVKQKHHTEFVKETRNIWIKSYKKSRGFVKAMILQKKNEFLTIDVWKSKKYTDAFFKENLDRMLKFSYVPKRYTSRKSYVMS